MTEDDPITQTPATDEDDGNRAIPLSLDEFCGRLSRRDRRVELIGAFHFWMTHQRRMTFATEPEFQTAFHDFTGGTPAKE